MTSQSQLYEEEIGSWKNEIEDPQCWYLQYAHQYAWENIKIVFLPANITNVLQPMVQHVINCLIGYYRKNVLLKLIKEWNHRRKKPNSI